MSDMFKSVEQKTGVKMNDIMKLANSVKGINLQNEQEVRRLIGQVGRMANRRVPKRTEDQIVDMLVHQKKSIDANTIDKMLKKRR